MKNKNIKEMTETESHLYKRLYFIKTEAQDLYFEEDEDEPRSVSGELMGEFDIDPVDLINSFDKLFENCREYNLDDKL